MTANYFYLAIALVLADNVLLSRLAGAELIFKRYNTFRAGMMYGIFVFVLSLISGFLSFTVYSLVLRPISAGFLSTFITVLISFAIIELIRYIMKSSPKDDFKEFGESVPMLSVNCVAIVAVELSKVYSLNYGGGLLMVLFASIGFVLSLFIIESIKEKLHRGSIALIILSLSFASMALLGFTGVGF